MSAGRGAGEAGPELDAEVAGIIFDIPVLGIVSCHPWHDGSGWYACHCVGQCPMGQAVLMPVFSMAHHCPGEHEQIDDEPMILGHNWPCLTVAEEYSEDIAAAWLVVERMRESGWQYELKAVIHGDYQWFVTFKRVTDDDSIVGYSACGPDAPTAICRAALEVPQ